MFEILKEAKVMEAHSQIVVILRIDRELLNCSGFTKMINEELPL